MVYACTVMYVAYTSSNGKKLTMCEMASNRLIRPGTIVNIILRNVYAYIISDSFCGARSVRSCIGCPDARSLAIVTYEHTLTTTKVMRYIIQVKSSTDRAFGLLYRVIYTQYNMTSVTIPMTRWISASPKI